MKVKALDYPVTPYSKIRRLMAISFRLSRHMPLIHGLLEVDVSRAAQQEAQIVNDSFKTAGGQPALRLLIHNSPGRQVMRHHAPTRSRAHQRVQAIEHFSQFRVSLSGTFRQQAQLRCYEGPFLVSDIRRIRFSGRHTTILPAGGYRVPNRLQDEISSRYLKERRKRWQKVSTRSLSW
jgi:hypothetical protein